MKTVLLKVLIVSFLCVCTTRAADGGDNFKTNNDKTQLTPSLGNPTIIKCWEYGYTEKGAWAYMYKDIWGGLNYQCKLEGDQCGKWDWCAVYDGFTASDDPCPENNNPEYGDGLVRNQAVKEGIQLPPDLPLLPEFRIEYRDE